MPVRVRFPSPAPDLAWVQQGGAKGLDTPTPRTYKADLRVGCDPAGVAQRQVRSLKIRQQE